MSTSAVSSLSILQELQSFYQTRQSDLKQLGSALQSGDLNGAKQAFTALAVLGEGGPFANSEPFGKSTRAQAFNDLGEALQAGDVSRAQSDFAALTSKPPAAPQTTPAAVVNLSNTQPSAAAATPTDSAASIYQQLQAYRQQRNADLAQLGKDLQAGDLTAAQTDFNTLTALGQTGPNKNGQTFGRTDRNQDFQAIGQALQSGDLAGAQSAFATLQGTFGKQSQQAQTAIAAYTSTPPEIVINIGAPPASTGVLSTQPPTTTPPVVTSPPTQPPVVSSPPTEPPVVQGPPVSQPPTISSPPAAPEIVINLGGASNTNASGSTTGSNTPEIVVNLGQGGSSTSPASEEVVINFDSGSSAQITIDANQGQTGSNPEQVTINLGQPSTASSTPPEEVAINLGSGSSGAQITVGPNQGQSSSSADQVTINLNQTQNYELILNLLNTAALTQSQSSSNALSISA